MLEVNEATNNPTVTDTVSTSFSSEEELLSTLNDEPEGPGAGADATFDPEKKPDTTSDPKAPNVGKAPVTAGQAKPGATEQPKGLFWKIDGINQEEYKQHLESMKAQGLLSDEGIDALKLLKNTHELQRFNTESRQAVAGMRSQLQALQNKEETKVEPVTIEDVKKNFAETKKDLNSLYSNGQRLISGTITPEETKQIGQRMMELAQAEYDAAETEYEKQTEDLRISKLKEEFGFTKKANDTVNEGDVVGKASENVLAVLSKEEQTPEWIKKILGGNEVLAVLNTLAGALYPKLYGKGEGEQLAKNNKLAVNSVLANNPEIAKSIVELGKKSSAFGGFDQRIQDTEKAAYERGLVDGRKGIKPGDTKPASSAVKAPVISQEQSSEMDSLVTTHDWGA